MTLQEVDTLEPLDLQNVFVVLLWSRKLGSLFLPADPLMLGVAGASDQQVEALLFVFETLAPLFQIHLFGI